METMKKRAYVEALSVVLLAALSTFSILWKTILSPGLIYVRDSYPQLISTPPQLVSDGVINLLFIMDNPDLPVYLSSYFLSSEIVDKLSYAYPVFLGFISIYFSVKYFVRKLTGKVNITTYVVSTVTAFMFVASPSFMYFTYWLDYSTFVALYPSLLATLDYASTKPGYKSAILLALVASLTTTDPRGFAYTALTALAFALYKVRDYKFVKTFLLAIPIYFGLNIRTFVSLFLQGSVYNGLGTSIEVQQLWLNYYTYPFLYNLRGVGVFRPLVTFYFNQYIYLFSLLLPAFVVLGVAYYFGKLRKSSIPFILLVYMGVVVVESSTITLFGKTFTMNLVYFINNALINTPAFPYMWIFLPTYVEEVIPGALFLLAGTVMGVFIDDVFTHHKKSQLLAVLFLVFIVTAQLTSSFTSFNGGDYSGNYVPYPVAPPLYKVASYLEGHAQGKVALYVQPIVYDGKIYPEEPFAGLPGATLLPFYNTTNVSTVLSFYGVQFVVTNEPDLVKFFGHVGGFKEVYCTNGIYVFKNTQFSEEFTSHGVYILASYPENLSLVPPHTAVVPPYVHVPPKFLAGVINGGKQYLLWDIYNNYSVEVPVQRLGGFSCTITITPYSQSIVNTFPGAPLIQVSPPASETVEVPWGKGYYCVILSYVQYPQGGVISVSNGTYTKAFSTVGPLRVVDLGVKVYLNGKLTVSSSGSGDDYLLGIEAIPYELAQQDIHLSPPHDVEAVYFPVANVTVPSISYNIVAGKVVKPKNPDLLPLILLNFAVFLTVLFEYFKREK
ncbi:hypothetical protein [Stygiolobus caldivivus]|uniref:Uncharacterized protein n=1 Tax=Stygiolobus caldivivus TaxID=2824673 RepID=A0A8D5U8R7_9CREN|nr:hypothetical protein [Stygiolobus caldivivus]BCU70836.1 hypothetical protein KN1_21330 [Stygiolobus caldivivus]